MEKVTFDMGKLKLDSDGEIIGNSAIGSRLSKKFASDFLQRAGFEAQEVNASLDKIEATAQRTGRGYGVWTVEGGEAEIGVMARLGML